MVSKSHGIKVSNSYVCQVLRNDIGLGYRQIKKVPYLGNTIRCLILRQMYAKFMLEKLTTDVRVINID